MSRAKVEVDVSKMIRPDGFAEEMDALACVGYLVKHFKNYMKAESKEEEDWTDSMIAVLKPYEGAVLAQACLIIMRTRTVKEFPLPAQITNICDTIIRERNRPTLIAQEQEDYRANPWSDFRTDLVFDLLKGSPMGHQAAKEGWIGTLVHWVRMNAELPPQSMIYGLKIRAREFDETLLAVHRGDGFPKTPDGVGHAAACGRLGESMNARAKAWADAILHGASRENLYTRKGWRHRRDDARVEDERARMLDRGDNYSGGRS